LGREAAAEALIDRELRDIMPRLEFVAPYQFLHRRLVFVGDPFHAQGFLDIAEDLGCAVPFVGVTACARRGREVVAPPGTEVMVDPRLTAFVRRFGVLSQSAHLVVSCNTGASRQEHGYLEFGFLSYYRHALYDRPFLGFRGFMAFVDDMARELVRVDLVRVQAERDAAEGGGPGAALLAGPGGGGGH